MIENSATLFEEEGTLYLLVESYAQLKSETGETDFVTFLQERKPFEKPADMKIRAFSPFAWERN